VLALLGLVGEKFGSVHPAVLHMVAPMFLCFLL